MLDGFQGETVTVSPLCFGVPDDFGNRMKFYGEAVEVHDVLVAPGSARDTISDGAPDAAEITFTLYVPKGVDVEWRGAKVVVAGQECRVVGNPQAWPEHLVLGSRNLVVEVSAHV